MVLLVHRARDPRAVQRGRALQGLRRRASRARSNPSLSWLTPTNFGGIERARRRAARRRLHLLGLGHRDERQRGVRGLEPRRPGSRACSRRSSSSAIYVIVTIAAQAVQGRRLPHRQLRRRAVGHRARRVRRSGFGSVALKLLIIAVLTSSAASCQTTILPAARTRALDGAAPRLPAKVRRGRPPPPHAGVLDLALRHLLVRVVHCCWSLAEPRQRRRRARPGRSTASA